MNKLLPKVGEYVFMAEPFHCDFLGRLSIGHLGNLCSMQQIFILMNVVME